MSGSLSATTSGATSGFQMSSSTEAQINADASSFDSLVGQGASTQQQSAAAQTLDSDFTDAIDQSYGSNTSGLNDDSRRVMSGARDQLDEMMSSIGSSAGASALQQFAQNVEAATSQATPASSALASPDAVSGDASDGVSSKGSGMMQMMQEMMQLLGQAVQMMEGGKTGGTSLVPSSTATTNPALTQQLTPETDAATPSPASTISDTSLRPFMSLPLTTGVTQLGAGTSGPQATGNVAQDAQTLMSLIGGVGTNANMLGSFASALGKEAASQGNSAVANWANNLAGSLGNGTYDQQGSMSAGMAAMQGKGVNSVQNNMSAILTQLESGQSKSSVGNNLNALATELKDAGKPGLADQMSKLASGLQNGSVSEPQAAQLMQIMQMLSQLGSTGGAASSPATTPATTPATLTAPVTGSLGDGPQVSSNGKEQLEQMIKMLEEMMMEMMQMMQGGLSQAA